MTGRISISISSNRDDRDSLMDSTVRWLKSCFDSVTVSDIYEMNAINGTDAPYLNAVAMASTDMTPDEVISLLKRWELHCGRTPASKSSGIIPMDLDLITWNGTILRPKEFSRAYFSRGYNQLMESEHA